MRTLIIGLCSLLLSACGDSNDRNPKYQPGQIVQIRLTESIGMIMDSACNEEICSYTVKVPTSEGDAWRTYRWIKEFELQKVK